MNGRQSLCLLLSLGIALGPNLGCSSDGSDSSSGTTVLLEDALSTQNDDAAAFASTIEELFESVARVEERIAEHDPTTFLDLDPQLTDRDQLLVALRALGDSLSASDAQVGSLARGLVDEGPLAFEPAALGTIAAVCLTTLAVGAYVAGMVGAMEESDRALRACYDTYEETVVTGQVTEEEGFAEYARCRDRARSQEKDAMFLATGGAIFSFFGPSIPATDGGKLLVTSTSAAIDAGGVTVYFLDREGGESGRQGIGKPDADGTVTLPPGEWDVVVFSDGQARSGPEDGVSVTILPGDTVTLDVDPVPVEDAADTCDPEDEPTPAPPPTDDPPPTDNPPFATLDYTGTYSGMVSGSPSGLLFSPCPVGGTIQFTVVSDGDPSCETAPCGVTGTTTVVFESDLGSETIAVTGVVGAGGSFTLRADNGFDVATSTGTLDPISAGSYPYSTANGCGGSFTAVQRQ